VEKNMKEILDDYFQSEVYLKDREDNAMNYFEVFVLFDMEENFDDFDHAVVKHMLMEELVVHLNIVQWVTMS
jgi:hypothetical protein